MRVARLLLCCVLLEDYCSNVGAAITSDIVHHQDFSSEQNTATLLDNNVPSFATAIGNVTVASGREAILSCTIRSLGKYKVAWLRNENQMILSMGTRSITNPQKFSVSLENMRTKTNLTTGRNEDEATWKLHIRNVKEQDRGCYMCQVNTKPMLNQLGCVDVLVAPDILTSGTSESEVIVKEGENATLECKASGRPTPTVAWKKEKDALLVRKNRDQFIKVETFAGERLELIRVDRKQMGAYLCIATNDVPPGVSKRVYLRVHFSPTAKVKNQLVGSPLGTDVSLVCEIESFPRTINMWQRGKQVVSISSGGRFVSNETVNEKEEWKTTIELKIMQLQAEDLDEYKCIAKSVIGEAEATLRLYQIEGVTQSTRATSTSGKRFSGGNSSWRTTPKLSYSRTSTPMLQRSTVAFTYEKRKFITTTTPDSRVPLTKDHNAFKHNEIFDGSLGTIANSNFIIIAVALLVLSF
ncbi:lachesin [Diachasma alloeum]|uniref:lachesin n=1 Tax=Diachasma alloeum TaxID=454923 RepID=UPI0007381635|nr:lachesin [Diachasma alloeum]